MVLLAVYAFLGLGLLSIVLYYGVWEARKAPPERRGGYVAKVFALSGLPALPLLVTVIAVIVGGSRATTIFDEVMPTDPILLCLLLLLDIGIIYLYRNAVHKLMVKELVLRGDGRP